MPPGKPHELTLQHLCQILRAAGYLTEEQVRDIKIKAPGLEQKILVRTQSAGNAVRRAARYRVTPVEIVAELELIMPDGRRLNEDRIMEVIAQDVGLPFMKLDPVQLDPHLITDTFSRPFARHNCVIPVSRDRTTFVLAISDPYDANLLESLKRTLPQRPDFVVASKTDILKIINEMYGFRSSVKAAATDFGTASQLGNLEQLVNLSELGELEATDAHIVNAVEYLLHYAFDQRASDVHIEPKREIGIVRIRIDGVLHQIYQLPKVVHAPFVSRIKMLARMDIAEKRRPQDGRIKTQWHGREVELRVSSLAVAFGEKIVIRIFDPQHLLQDPSGLGFFDDDLERYRSFLGSSNGLILVTGPTGSGKTTTLYSTLRTLASPEINITTIEDPIEMVFEPFNQVQVQSKIDLTFASALRTVLRQDPDVVMVGEIRDEATANMAIQAALTGHLVLSTLHTNDAPSTIARLLEFNIKPFLIASTLLGIVAQRLLRRICPDCKSTTTLNDEQVSLLGIPLPSRSKRRLPVKFGTGCSSCRYTGLRGRVGVFEVMPITPAQRKLIMTSSDASELRKAAVADGMITLREAAIRRMAQGETSFEEVINVLGT